MRKKIVRCEDLSPTYRQIIKEKNEGYKFFNCTKKWKIIKQKQVKYEL
jgi:gluconate kinase